MFNHWLLSWVKGEALVSENNWNLWGKTKEWVFFLHLQESFYHNEEPARGCAERSGLEPQGSNFPRHPCLKLDQVYVKG